MGPSPATGRERVVQGWSTNLLNLLHTLELDEEDDGVYLVVVEALHGAKMHIQDAVLVLEK